MNKVIILLGPTCSGKTGAAILLARALNTEIISADSMQIYRRMDIGTAKPSKKELRAVPHHLIDIIEPHEEFSAGRFLEEAVPVIKRLHGENKIPLVVGGTGLYIKAMTRGLFSAPSADDELRGELLGLEERGGLELRALLKELDPEAAALIAPADKRRILRALEVCIKSGKSFSGMKKALTAPLPYEFIKIGISRSRPELYALIEKRVDEMLRRGLAREVKRILAAATEKPSKTAMQAIGYKEIASYLKGLYTSDEAERLIKRNTRRYAKRQFTWFKKEEAVHWVDASGLDNPQQIFELVKERLSELAPGIPSRQFRVPAAS